MKKNNMRKNCTEGKLITFCGLDGCGKTTLIHKLMEEIGDQHKLYLTKQPTDAVRQSEIFRTYMDSPNHNDYDYRSLSLLAAGDRIQHVSKVIEPKMKEGFIVISDRYFYSCLANLRARGFYKDKWIYEISNYMIKPDISFFIDVPVDIAISRVRNRMAERDRYIDVDLQHKLRAEYIRICQQYNGILISSENTVEDTFKLVMETVKRKIYNEK